MVRTMGHCKQGLCQSEVTVVLSCSPRLSGKEKGASTGEIRGTRNVLGRLQGGGGREAELMDRRREGDGEPTLANRPRTGCAGGNAGAICDEVCVFA